MVNVKRCPRSLQLRRKILKTIKQETSLVGKFETISVSDFRNRPGEVFASVDLGKTFLVTKLGKPIAVISKPPGESLTMEIESDGTLKYVQ